MEIRKEDNKIIVKDTIGFLETYTYKWIFERHPDGITGEIVYPRTKNSYNREKLSKKELIQVLENLVRQSEGEEGHNLLLELLEEVRKEVKKVYLANSFSLGMLNENSQQYLIKIEEVSIEEVKKILNSNFVSAVGHEPTAQLLSEMLGIEVVPNRIQVKLEKGDTVIVFQLLQRLPEGKIMSKEELKAVPHKWYRLTII